MEKIFTFIMNKEKELLLLEGSPNDPQYHKSFWYVVTGGKEDYDKNLEETVKREIKEETNLDTVKIKYLNWIFKYNSLDKECTEYVFISLVNDNTIILNEEHINYKWCKIDEFIDKIEWYGDKKELQDVIKKAIDWKVFFKTEKTAIY